MNASGFAVFGVLMLVLIGAVCMVALTWHYPEDDEHEVRTEVPKEALKPGPVDVEVWWCLHRPTVPLCSHEECRPKSTPPA